MTFKFLCRLLLVPAFGMLVPSVVMSASLDVLEIVKNCDFKNPGNDQRSILAITLIDKDEKSRKNIYLRFWKNYKGEGGLLDKMVLFTQHPPEAKGTGFMRWGYLSVQNKPADQWIYLPQSRKVRRVSVRDPGDSFLGSDLTYGDMEDRPIELDRYRLLEAKKNESFFVIEAYPKEKGALYSKKLIHYKKASDWGSCVRVKTDYYDRHGGLLKEQSLTWQKIKDAWVWDRVVVENVQTRHKSIFEVSDVEVNIGVKSRVFTERSLKKGP